MECMLFMVEVSVVVCVCEVVLGVVLVSVM